MRRDDNRGRHKVSGVVVAVEPSKSVAFTRARHNDNDERGAESLVRFEVEPDAAGGTRLALVHSALGDEESAENHDKGWSSSLKKFERPANQP